MATRYVKIICILHSATRWHLIVCLYKVTLKTCLQCIWKTSKSHCHAFFPSKPKVMLRRKGCYYFFKPPINCKLPNKNCKKSFTIHQESLCGRYLQGLTLLFNKALCQNIKEAFRRQVVCGTQGRRQASFQSIGSVGRMDVGVHVSPWAPTLLPGEPTCQGVTSDGHPMALQSPPPASKLPMPINSIPMFLESQYDLIKVEDHIASFKHVFYQKC